MMKRELRRSRFGAMGSIVLAAGFAALAAPAGQADDGRIPTFRTAAPLPDTRESGTDEGGVAGPCPVSACGQVGCSISQSIDQSTNGNNQVACGIIGGGTNQNGWARCYNRALEGLPSGDVQIGLVTFGVQQATANGINVNVNLYLDNTACPPAQPGGDAQLLASVPLVVNTSDMGTFRTADFTGLAPMWPDGQDLVVEIEQVDDGTAVEPQFSFRPMSNPGGQCGPSYIRAADCGAPGWIDVALAGFPDAHLIQVVAASIVGPPPVQDKFVTCGEPNSLQFGGPDVPPIPPGFFGPGSEPFVGIVQFQGEPLGLPGLGAVDTIIQRPPFSFIPDDPPGTVDQVPIEIISLSLVSVNPITVTYPQGPPQLWDVTINLSNMNPPPGAMTATKTHQNGGTFDAILRVQPKFVFTHGPDIRVLDTGKIPLPPNNLVIELAPWVHEPSPNIPLIDPSSDFVPGIQETIPGDIFSQVVTPFTASTPSDTIMHTVCPATEPPCPFDLDGNGNVGITDLLILLANWGNPYGINDLLDLLAAWGPC